VGLDLVGVEDLGEVFDLNQVLGYFGHRHLSLLRFGCGGSA
jgi:hypothetical protein